MAGSYKKKLIEVAMPLEAINKASVREKSLRHGHPSTLHLYWSRKPLATCRAVIFAQLVDDPSAHLDQFPTEAEQKTERDRLFAIIEELVIWENSTNEEVLKKARLEILKSCDGKLPPIYDPFSGGGSIPLEAQRLGLPAYGSDLNPVAVMIGKAMIEIPPLFKNMNPIHPGPKEKLNYKHAEGLAEDVKYYGEWMRQKAFENIGHLYPSVDLLPEHGGGKANVIAWIWARTVPSPDPAFNEVAVPIVSSFLLSSKKGKEVYIEPVVDRIARTIDYRIIEGGTPDQHALAKAGTQAQRGAHFTCVLSGSAIEPNYIKDKAKQGRMGCQLISIVAKGQRGRVYLPPNPLHIATANIDRPDNISFVPLPKHPQYIGVLNYGFDYFEDLFTNRQLYCLQHFSTIFKELENEIMQNKVAFDVNDANDGGLADGVAGPKAYAQAITLYLTFALSKCSDYWSSTCTWHSSGEKMRNTFGRQAIPMTWGYTEANPFSTSTGNWMAMVDWVWKALSQLPTGSVSKIKHQDAQTVKYPCDAVISTDPPYYDNIGYADLSDFFFSWMKSNLKTIYPEIFSVMATPKSDELVADRIRHGSKEKADTFFLKGMTQVIKNMANQTSDIAPTAIYYAFKQSEIEQEGISSTGWATFLQAVIESGYAVVGTWPMRTELSNRLRSTGFNALANSIVLVCRKRNLSMGKVTRAEFIRQLKTELPKAVNDLKAANIAPTDIPQSSIGPGIGIYSRYEAVLENDDKPMSVKTALQLINRELGEDEGDFDAETSFAIIWFEQHGFNVGEFGAANNIANAKGISVEALVRAGIAKSRGGKFSLINRKNLEEGWDPHADKNITIWECCQYIIRRRENKGEFEAAKLMNSMGPERADNAKDLAYILYNISAYKRKDATEATAYNGLVSDWFDLTAQAAKVTENEKYDETQMSML